MRFWLLGLVLLIPTFAHAGPFSFHNISYIYPSYDESARLSTVTYDVRGIGEKTFKLPDPYKVLPNKVGDFATNDLGLLTYKGQLFQDYLSEHRITPPWNLTRVLAVSTDGLAVLGYGRPTSSMGYMDNWQFLATIPEPSTWILLTIGALVLCGIRRS